MNLLNIVETIKVIEYSKFLQHKSIRISMCWTAGKHEL